MYALSRLVSRLIGSLFLVLIACSAAPANASGGVVGEALAVCIARAAPGMTAQERFSAKARYDCTTRQNNLGPGDYWVRSQPLAGIDRLDERRNVRINSLWQDVVTLYARYPDGTIWSERLDGRDVSRHLQLGTIVEWTLPSVAQHGAPEQLLWHVEHAANLRGVVMKATLATPEESNRANLELSAIYAAFGGLCIALLIYNLAMYGALRHPFQLAYCAMVMALLFYGFTSSGAMAWWDMGMVNNDRVRLNYLLLAAAAIAALNFARCFFEPSVSRGWVGRYIQGSCALVALSATALAVLAPWQIRWLDSAYSISFLVLMLAIPAVIYRAFKVKSRHLWLFAIAWGAPIVFAGVRLLANLAMIPWSFWIDNSTILAMSFEALMSSLAIAYRIRILLVERDEARANEIAARMLAERDPLTGLINRRGFMNRAIGREGAQTLFIIDIDHFKRVNETLGHDGGDEVLRVFARVLRTITPGEALVARMGGEEFAVLVSAARDALDAEGILASLRAARMPFDLRVTASIGTCTGPLANERDWKRMYRSADSALFEAKAAGRDRVRIGSISAIAA